jgi:hypothetical protein
MEITTVPENSRLSDIRRRETRNPPPFKQLNQKKSSGLPDAMEEALLQTIKEAIDDEKASVEGGGTLPFPPSHSFECAAASLAATPIELTAEVLDFFEKSVNAIAYLHHSGDSETTFYLDTARFPGTKIIVREFNTAPRAFNISLIGSPESVTLFNSHAADLIAAFQKTPFNYTVHRLESDIHPYYVTEKEDLAEEREEG